MSRLRELSVFFGNTLTHGCSAVVALTRGVPYAATRGAFLGSLGWSDGDDRPLSECLRGRQKDLTGREQISSRTSCLLWLHCDCRHPRGIAGNNVRFFPEGIPLDCSDDYLGCLVDHLGRWVIRWLSCDRSWFVLLSFSDFTLAIRTDIACLREDHDEKPLEVFRSYGGKHGYFCSGFQEPYHKDV